MNVDFLDFIFPFVVFGYGLVMTFVLTYEPLVRMADERLPEPIWTQMKAHRILALVCLVIGSLWSLQHLMQ